MILDLLSHHFERARELYADHWLGFSEVELHQTAGGSGIQENRGDRGLARKRKPAFPNGVRDRREVAPSRLRRSASSILNYSLSAGATSSRRRLCSQRRERASHWSSIAEGQKTPRATPGPQLHRQCAGRCRFPQALDPRLDTVRSDSRFFEVLDRSAFRPIKFRRCQNKACRVPKITFTWLPRTEEHGLSTSRRSSVHSQVEV